MRTALALTLTLSSLLGCATLSSPAQAQTPPATAAPDASRHPQFLREIGDEIRWNVTEQGALLLIDAPNPYGPGIRSRALDQDGFALKALPKMPSGLAIRDVEDYFYYRAVKCGSISTLAPQMMSTLNYQNLPKPSAYAGVRSQDRYRFLLASLTPAQWAKVGSADGLGAGDLDRDQRELWAGMLGPDMVLRGGPNGEERLEVTPQMRRQMRLRIARRITWMFQQGTSVTSTYTEKADSRWTLMETPNPQQRRQERHSLFGKEILTEVPSRVKPTDLAWEWEGLDSAIRLADAKTVGDLVERIAKACRLALYCDPRYRNLPVYTRGDTARAGDVLKAICRSVTGTVRRVGAVSGAYVVTDDLVGLGTRHALIGDWAAQNASLTSQLARTLDARLKDAHLGKFLTYDSSDPLAPDAKTIGRIAAHQKTVKPDASDILLREGEWLKTRLWVPVQDLPPALQDVVRAQMAQLQKDNGSVQAALRTDAVTPFMDSATYLMFPGIGQVTANFGSGLSSYFEEQGPFPRVGFVSAPWEPKPLTPRITRRGLMVLVETVPEARALAREAHRAGFTELWIEAYPARDGKANFPLLTSAVQYARQENLVPRVTVRPFRSANPPASVAVERNIQGETWSQFAARLVSTQPWSLPPFGPAMGEEAIRYSNDLKTQNLDRERRMGDWLFGEAEADRDAAIGRVRQAASVPGIAGVIVRDMVPPGFTETPPFLTGYGQDNPGRMLGYTPARRLAFLRKHGVDPIDLSENDGQFRQADFGNSVPPPDAQLPFFPGNTQREKALWTAARQTEAQATLNNVFPALRQAAGDKPVWMYDSPSDPTGDAIQLLYVESREKDAALPDAAPVSEEGTIQFKDPAQTARKRSSVVLMTLLCQPFVGTTQQEQFLHEIASYADMNFSNPKNNPLGGYDNGLIVDFSRRNPDAALAHLRALPPFNGKATGNPKP